MRPTGWFQVGYGADIAIGAVVALRYFGEDLVRFSRQGGRTARARRHAHTSARASLTAAA